MPEERPAATGFRVPFSAEWFAELRQSLIIMGRVIYALIMREARTRYGSSNFGYAWAIVDPLVTLAVFVGIFSALGRASPIPGMAMSTCPAREVESAVFSRKSSNDMGPA